MYAADTIAAIATPAGTGGIGIVRVSGPLSLEIAQRVFRSDLTNGWQSHRFCHGSVRNQRGDLLDEGLAVVMRAPHSYTGEDVLELHCHGSPVGLRRVLQAVLSCGARLAEPGEFTRRAFLNGRLDLAQAEAVIELIRARNDAGATMAVELLQGRLSNVLAELRQQLIEIRALLEVQIDFSEEDVLIDPEQLRERIRVVLDRLSDLQASYQRGRLVRDGLQVVITGKPNVGKSSLLNALLREDRAIVTSIPGTTRDIVEETADFDGVPVVLCDSAGLRMPSDRVEEIGVERARAAIARADVVIAVFDGSLPLDAQDADVMDSVAGCRVAAVVNKSDLPAAFSPRELSLRLGLVPVLDVSALRGTGLDALRKAVVALPSGSREMDRDLPTVTLVRHRDALEKAADALQLAMEGVEASVPPDLVAVDVQNAADQIAAITGAISSEDVLDRIFAEFCIGK